MKPTVAALLLACLAACGGNGGTTPNPSPSPSPSPSPGPAPAQNPCSTVSLEEEDQLAARPEEPGGSRGADKRDRTDGSHPWRVLDDIYSHRAARLRRITPVQPATSTDVGDIAVLQDQGDLVLRANQLDLVDSGLRFTRNNSGGYDVGRTDAAFRQTLGSRITLTDDDARAATVPFPFQFFGQTQSAAFVNSDGNITFGEPDTASTERNLSRVLTGAPRVAVFFADLDPSTGGSVWVNATGSEFTVTWCGVRGFESTRVTTVQTTLTPDGTVDVKIASPTTLADAIVALSPGRTGDFTPVDLSAQGPTGGGGAAVGERFAESGQLDTVAVANAFFQSHPDQYDQLVMWTDTRLLTTAFAYESTVKNEIRGIGIDLYDVAREFGSGGTLGSVVVMDALTKYPDDPVQQFRGENSTLSILGQETGHRWLVFLRFSNSLQTRSTALLGRDEAHWSFFMDSDGSVMEGNDIEDLGGGTFRTGAAVRRYSRLDQYAMGLVRDSDVPPFFYVESPVNTTRTPESAPRANETFNGTRRDVLIQDVIAAMGRRSPSPDASPRVHRQAFIYVVSGVADRGQVTKLDRIRSAWEPFFLQATEGRMRAETRLRP
jgi:hypothetical protein